MPAPQKATSRAAVPLAGVRHRGRDVGVAGDVAGQGRDAREQRHAGRLAVERQHLRAGRGEGAHHGAPDAAGRAGDERNLAVQGAARAGLVHARRLLHRPTAAEGRALPGAAPGGMVG